MPVDNKSIMFFEDAAAWESWLAKNYAHSDGIWIQFAKKRSGKTTVQPQEALEVALCYGWIDGQIGKYDDEYYIVKHTIRSARSSWSKRNQDIVARLSSERRMRPAGLAEVERAKKDGRWALAYDSQQNMKMPDDFLKEVAKDASAKAFFETLNKSNLYSIAWRLQTAAKPETRQRRMEKIIAMMKAGEKFH